MMTTPTLAEQVLSSPAEVYDEQFVPALFRPWGPVLCEAARIAPGQRVLDVACGTGALTSAVAARVGAQGVVLGLDANPQMLAVARRKHPTIEWHDGRAEALPFADASFDAVVSQFGLMFFDDPVAALREMRRVLRPGGRLAVAVCDALDHSPGYAALAALLERLFGTAVADAFRAPFVLGAPAKLRALCRDAGIADAEVVQRQGTVRFGSIDALVSTERACVWTLGGLLDDSQFAQLRLEAQQVFRPFVDAAGQVAFAMPALLIRATPDRSTMTDAAGAVRELYAAFARGDVPAVLGALASDVHWTEAEGFPHGGTCVGPDAVLREVFMPLAAEWEHFTATPQEFIVDAGTVVALGEYSGTSKASGASFTAPFAHVWRLRDGKVCAFRQHTDTALVQRAMRP